MGRTTALLSWTFCLAVCSRAHALDSRLAPAIHEAEFVAPETVLALLTELSQAHPEHLRVSTIARSRGGRPVLAATLSPASAPSRACTLVVSGIRPEDARGTQVALEMIAFLASSPEALAERTVHIVPQLNPDLAGSELPYDVRGRLNGEPDDADADGRQDEDGADDLDGDGAVRSLRWRPSGGDWHQEIEARDNDEDGTRAEDGAGSVDLSVHFPAFWEPAHRQRGAGISPLWEPEARGLVDWVLGLDHTGTALVLSGEVERSPSQTKPRVLWPPNAGDAAGGVPEADRGLLASFGRQVAERLEAEGSPGCEHAARPGTLLDWLYWHAGMLPVEVLVPCLCEPPAEAPWDPAPHPDLGQVEIGGSVASPTAATASAARTELPQLAETLIAASGRAPRLEVVPWVERVDDQVNAVYRIRASVRNDGDAPTATKRGAALHRGPATSLTLTGADEAQPAILLGTSRVLLGDLAPGRQSHDVYWLVQARPGTRILLTANSSLGGGTAVRIELE